MPENLVERVVPDAFMLIGVAFIIIGNLTDIIDFSRLKALVKGRKQIE